VTAENSSIQAAQFELRIAGANGQHDVLIRSPEDRRGAASLAGQLAAATVGALSAVEAAGPMLPHYRVGLRHVSLSYAAAPWTVANEVRFTYYPGRPGHEFLLVAFARADVQEERWIAPDSAVTAMLTRHAQGLSPIVGPVAGPAAGRAAGLGTAASGWPTIAGIGLIAALVLLLFEDRRRRTLGNGSTGKRGHETGAP
jgi:hypothetical protein